ncbi:cell adhesion molecule CEACAM19-like [Discoglossus pictus]
MFINTSLRGFVMTVLLSLWMDRAIGINIQLIPQDPKVGMSVLLNVSNIAGPIRSITWYKGINPSSENQILNNIPGLESPQTNGLEYFAEVQVFKNGSLLISNLKKQFEGNYTVQIQAMNADQASVYLPVIGFAHIGLPSLGLLLGMLLFSCFTFL